MHSVALLIRSLALLAAGMLAWADAAVAQAFSADYSLPRAVMQAGREPTGIAARDALLLAGGYQWGDGQSLSLQLTGGRRGNRLGLALSYDWPRYFVRLSYDTWINPVPQDNLRFSAGMRF
jgi:hypothetical protein